MNLKNFLKTLLALAVFVILVSSATFAQLSTVYVDVTNGSDTYSGANATNSPAGTGPKATINAGLGALANNGTLYIMAGTYNGGDGAGGSIAITTANYPNLAANGSLTIMLNNLNGNNQINLSTGTFTYDVSGGTLNFNATAGTEYLTLNNALNLGSATRNVTVNIPNQTYVQVVGGQTITMNGSSSFSNQAPKALGAINVSYQGGSSIAAGPESGYGSFGTGVITVNKTAGTTVTFPIAISAVGGINVTSGNATFNNSVTLGSNDVNNSGTGTVTFNSAVGFGIATGNTDANLGSVENTSTGSIVFSSTVTWTGTFAATNTFAAGAGTYVIDNQSTGSISFNSSLSFVSPNSAGNIVTLTANNGAGGTLTLGSIGYTTPSSSKVVLNVQNTAANGILNLAGGSVTGALTNGNATGTANINGALTVAGVFTNAGTTALGANTLTLSGAVAHMTAGGTVTATSAGGINVTSSGANSFNGGTLSNLTVSGSGNTSISGATNAANLTVSAGTLTVGANLTMSGTTTVSGGTLSINAFTLQTVGLVETSGTISLAAALSVLNVKGDFNRTTGTFTAAAGSTVQFTGTTAQNFAGGPLIEVSNLTFNNTAGTVTLAQSVRVDGLVTIAANTNLALNTLNIILFANNAGINNAGAYTATGGGGVIFGGVNTITGAAANYTGQTLSGTGVYSYLTVDVGTANFVLTTTTNVTFNGVLTLRSGNLQVGAGLDFGPAGNVALINRNVIGSVGGIDITTNAGATFNNAAPVDYDLTYSGALVAPTAVAVGTTEFSTVHVRNLTVSTTEAAALNVLNLTAAGAVTIKGNLTLTAPGTGLFNEFDLPAAQNVTINGTLTVPAGTVLGGGNAANPVALVGNNMAHVVAGTVSAAGVLTVTGTGSTLTGSTVAADAATIGNLAFEPAANNSGFTSSNLKVINNITVEGVSAATGTSATITMNGVTSTLNGNLTVGNGANTATASVTIAGTTTSVHGGSIVLTNGSLTYTRGGNSTVVGGGATLTAGTLTLGSNVSVTGATSQVAGNINAGGFVYTQLGSAATPDYNRTGAGTFTNGTLSLDATNADIDLTPGTTFTVPNLQSVGTANGVTINASMEVTNSFKQDKSSTFTQTGTLTVSGNTVTVTSTAGGFAGALTLTGAAATATFAQDYTIPTLTINTTGTVSFASNNSTARTVTVNAAFTNTAGTFALGINNLTITNPGTFTFTAGAITQGSGILTWNTAGAVSIPATGFAIDNLAVSTAVNVGTNAFAVNKNLWLNATLTTSADGKLTLGDGIMITRTANAAVLSKLPTFGANTDMTYKTYTGAASIVTAKEMPATVRNLTVASSDATPTNVDGIGVVLSANLTVSGTLSLADNLNATTNTKTITMADGSTLELKVNGLVALDKDLVKAGSMALVYNGATATSTRELGAISSGSHPTYTGAITVKAGPVALDANLTTSGVFTLDGANFDLNGSNLTLANNVTETANGGNFVNGGATKALTFSGATNTTFALDGNWTVPTSINFTLNKTNGTNTVTFSGGNLTFTNSPNLYFVNGLLVASGSQTVTLIQNNAGVGQAAIQGYDRTGVTGTNMSQIVGKVIKNVVSGPTGVGRYEFPTGSLTSYKPAAFTFASNPVYAFNLAVTEVDTTPGGSNGLPIANGVSSGVNIGSYPNFYWLISSDVNLGTAISFNLELTSAGFSNFSNVSDLRIIRRVDGDTTANPWVLQGASYDNYLVGSTPTVDNINSVGGINPAGARFTYGLKQVVPTSFTVSGKVTYGNGATGVKNVTVTLNPGGLTATTDTTGAYSFANVVNGTYTLTASTTNAWLGANATDALLASNYYNGTANLTSIQQLAADVNLSGTVNNTDALLIVRRFAGLDNSFAAGNWAFTPASVTVNGAAVTANIQALVAGDVNGSDNLSVLKTQPSVSINNEGTLKINPKDAFEVPVNATSSMSLGAVSLRFTYPTDLVTFEGASSNANLIVNDKNGQVTIAWADLSGGKDALNLKSGESLVTLKFKPTANFKVGSQFGLNLDGQYSEFAKEDGSVMGNVTLAAASVEASVPTEFTLKQNYPNPFNPSTTIEYDLPMNASVRLTIYNILGEQVSTLVNQIQTAGSYKVVWNADNFASGMYIYRITVESGSQKFTQVHRMMLLK